MAQDSEQPFQLDSSWTLSVGAESIQVNEDGSFLIPNISAPDDFGPGGPGTRPDFLSDDWVRLTGYSTLGGITRYCWTEPFKLTQNESVIISIGDLTFSLDPPPVPMSVLAKPLDKTLTVIGQTTQVTVIAFLANGMEKDVSSAALYTSFRTSNPNFATVSGDGLVTAKQEGKVFITAINEGATSVVQVNIAPGAGFTTITGVVTLPDGTPVADAEVVLAGLDLSAMTDATGAFTINDVPVSDALTIDAITVQSVSSAGSFFGSTTAPELADGNITDAGIIELMDLCDELGAIACVDSDNDCIPDIIEIELGLDPNNPDSDGNSIPDGEEDPDLDGLTNCAEIFLGTDPNLADSDFDGLDDGEEVFALGTNPRNPDTDFDGLRDGEEIFPPDGRSITDPFRADSDFDGIDDGLEVASNTDPLNPLSRPPLRIYSSSVEYLNAVLPEIATSDINHSIASSTVSYFNFIAIDSLTPDIIVMAVASSTVSYDNTAAVPPPPPDFTYAASSMVVAYLNAYDSALPDPAGSPDNMRSVSSYPVSFFNIVPEPENDDPVSTVKAFSSVVSYFNQP